VRLLPTQPRARHEGGLEAFGLANAFAQAGRARDDPGWVEVLESARPRRPPIEDEKNGTWASTPSVGAHQAFGSAVNTAERRSLNDAFSDCVGLTSKTEQPRDQESRSMFSKRCALATHEQRALCGATRR
jgi:hypothetical protein